jgi:hypothetical protein
MMMLERLIHALMERGAVFAAMEKAAQEYLKRRAAQGSLLR